MKKIDELKAEAKKLGVTFSPNIGEAKLQEKIDAAKKDLAEAKPEELEEEVADATSDWIKQAAAKSDKEEAEKESSQDKGGWSEAKRRKLAAQREAEARKTRIITIVDNDQRENNQTTSAVVTCSNAHFDLGTMVLPLGVEVEVMQGHINVLESDMIPQHTKGPNGNGITIMRPRYSISYSDKQPSEEG